MNRLLILGAIILCSINGLAQISIGTDLLPAWQRTGPYNHQISIPEIAALVDSISSQNRKTTDFLLGIEEIAFIQKNGVFIRLKTNDAAIASLRSVGREQQITRLVTQQNKQDSTILQAFRDHFTFGPVYYFYSRDIQSIKNGDFSKAFTIDGAPVNYKQKDFYVINPYDAPTASNGSVSTGFSLMDSSLTLLKDPTPAIMIKRFGFFYKTYPQLVFDWNYKFLELANFATTYTEEIYSRSIDAKSKEKALNAKFKASSKNFRKKYDFKSRPKKTNSGY